jgi:hypothetical protein
MNDSMIVKPVIVARTSATLPGCALGRVDAAVALIEMVPGVKCVNFDSHKRQLQIEYDLLINSYSKFNDLLIVNNIYGKGDIKFKLQSIWYDYLDTTARDNAQAPPAACCNKPPRRQ